ncbi:hypothetical protein KI387_043080, partial [Taxus chinensis]
VGVVFAVDMDSSSKSGDHDAIQAVSSRAALPRYFALRGPNGKYLGYVRDHPCRGFLSFCYDDLASPCVKHEVVEAQNGEAHVKCCYNDKFWSKNKPQEEWIVAAADSPNADRSTWSSTLFRAAPHHHAGKISLSSVLQGNGSHGLGVWEANSNNNNTNLDGPCLVTFNPSGDGEGEAYAYEAVSLVTFTFPPYVAFKGDNEKYLASFFWTMDSKSLIFNSSDIGDNLIRHQVEAVGDSEGHVWIKNLYWNQYWEVSPESSWVLADMSNISPQDMSMQFLPIQVDEANGGAAMQPGRPRVL